ncbi:MAG: fibronectin type III domain-containing protein [Anaerolineales bacterium]|nr:fibronectin type III domain-containing protein [Anaerolineales bacterium]
MKLKTLIVSGFVLISIFIYWGKPQKDVSAGNNCQKTVPVFTADTAPVDGYIAFKLYLGFDDSRKESWTFDWWEVKAGQQLDEVAQDVPAPRYVRLWWMPEFEDTIYLLPSQYWHGKGTAADIYGVSCRASTQPSYHTSFSQAIPEKDIQLGKSCTSAPSFISPGDGEVLNTIAPIFSLSHENEPNVIQFNRESSKYTDFSYLETWFSDEMLFDPELAEIIYTTVNYKPATTYYARAYYVCADGSEAYSQVIFFTTAASGEFLPAPQLISPSYDTSTTSGFEALSWEPVEGAIRYLVEWRPEGNKYFYFFRTDSPSASLRYLEPNTTYEWRITAQNEYAWGNKSATWRFHTPSFNQ